MFYNEDEWVNEPRPEPWPEIRQTRTAISWLVAWSAVVVALGCLFL